MFSQIRNTLPRQFARAYSSAASGGAKNGNGILWASLATGAVLAGGYMYTRSKEGGADIYSPAEPKPAALDPAKFVDFKLKEVIPINHDTKRFRFALEEGQELGMNVTSCLVVKDKVDGSEKPVIRPYTPVSPQHAQGYFDLVVKAYPQGKMSAHIHKLNPGDSLAMKGPIGKYPYKANELKEIGMVAGGSGITPMLQFIEQVLEDPKDNTKLTLIFANKSEEDIILKSELDAYAKSHPDQLKVHYVVDKASSKNWNGSVGYVTKDLVKELLPAASEGNVLVAACGPPPMMNFISGPKAPDYSQGKVGGIFKELGYTSEQVFKF